MKRIIISSAICLMVFLSILIVLPFMIDLNKYRDTILTQVKTYINRPVDFTAIRLTILSGLGVEISGLRIGEDKAFAEGDFLTIEHAQFRVAFLPLLSKQVKIRKIVLKEPALSIIRSNSEEYNYSSLLKPQPEKEKERPGLADTLFIKHVEIKKGRFMYRDEKSDTEKEPFVIGEIDLEASEVSLFRPVSFSIAAAVMSGEKQNLKASGTFGPLDLSQGAKATPLALHARLIELPIDKLPVKIPLYPGGTAGIEINASGNLAEKVKAEVKIDLNSLLNASGKTSLDASATSEMLLESAERLLINSGTLKIGQESAFFKGTIGNLGKAPVWDISLWSEGLSPQEIVSVVPMLDKLFPAQLSLEGPLKFKISTAGNLEDFSLKASAGITPIDLVYGTFFNKPKGIPLTMEASTRIQKGLTEISSFKADLDSMKIGGTGEFKSGSVKDTGRYAFTFRTGPIGLDRLSLYVAKLKEFKPSGTLTAEGSIKGQKNRLDMNLKAECPKLALTLMKPKAVPQKGTAEKSSILDKPVNSELSNMRLELIASKPKQGLGADGVLRASSGNIMNIPIRSLNGSFGYSDHRFTLKAMDIEAFKGSISSSASYDLKGKGWSASPRISNVQAGSILDIFSSFRGVFTGTLSASVKAQGKASGGPAAKTLRAETDAQISQGEWKNFDISGTVLGGLVSLPGFLQATGISSKEVQAYQFTRFDSMKTATKMEKGVMQIDSLSLNNVQIGSDQDAIARLKGTYNLATQALNLKGTIALPTKMSKRLSDKAGALKRLQDDTGRVTLPMTIGGTLKKPVPAIDTRAVKDSLASYLANQAIEKGMQKLQEKTGIPKETGKEAEKFIRDIFR